jgi:hypothetical protein
LSRIHYLMNSVMKAFLRISLILLVVSTFSCRKDKAVVPTVTTTEITELSYFSATSGGVITNDGGASIISKGICWNSSANPTINDFKTSESGNAENFVSKMARLNNNTAYYVRAYATNIAGTGYGEEVTFTTLQTSVPALNTTPVTTISYRSAVSGGTISSDNGEPILERGICWSKSQNPTITDSKISSETGTGSFVATLSPLEISTTYYVRSYAINHVGISYGTQQSFLTLTPTIPSLTTSPVSSISNNSAVSGGTITSENGQPVSARGICWSTNPLPLISDSKVNTGSGIGTFISSLNGLTPNTTYYIRAFAQNSVGLAYGDQVTFNTTALTGSINDGLIAYYPFNGNALDRSGNTNNGVVNGATLSEDIFGHPKSAYLFNGTGNYISLLPSANFKGLNNYSISLWVKPTEIVYNSGEMIYSLGSNVLGPVQGLTYQSNTTLFAGSYNVGTNPIQSYSRSCCFNTNSWVYVVVTRSDTHINLYINGSLISPQPESATNGQSADYGTVSAAILGGRSSLDYQYFFKGIIDEVRIYNRALSSDEILTLKALNQ